MSKFGKIAVAQVTENGWELYATEFGGTSKSKAVQFIEEEMERNPNLQLQIIRVYPEVYEVQEVTEPRRELTTTVDHRFADPDAQDTEESTEETPQEPQEAEEATQEPKEEDEEHSPVAAAE